MMKFIHFWWAFSSLFRQVPLYSKYSQQIRHTSHLKGSYGVPFVGLKYHLSYTFAFARGLLPDT